MKPSRDKWNIVLAGNWNPAIFNPEWLGNNLFSSKENITVEFSFLPGLPPKITGDGVAIRPSASRVVLVPSSEDDDSLAKAEGLAYKLLDLLPHTPIQGVGINFYFAEEDVDNHILGLFNDGDAGTLGDAGFTIVRRSTTRRLLKDDQTINLTLDFGMKNEIKFAMNFHTPAKDAVEAKRALEGKFVHHKATAINLLEKVYGLTMENK